MAVGVGGWGLTCSRGDGTCLCPCENRAQPLRGRPASCLHCADEETEALTGRVLPQSPRQGGAETQAQDWSVRCPFTAPPPPGTGHLGARTAVRARCSCLQGSYTSGKETGWRLDQTRCDPASSSLGLRVIICRVNSAPFPPPFITASGIARQ